MNDIKIKLDELFSEIKESTVYNDYVKAKDMLYKNEEILRIIDDIKRLQKIEANTKDSSISMELKKLYSKLESYPLYQSYLSIKEQLNDDLFEVKELFEKYIKEKLFLI